MDYRYLMPTQVECGAGLASRAGEFITGLGVSRVLIVTDEGIVKTNMVDRILDSLEKSEIEFVVFDKVEPNPSSECIMRGLEIMNEGGCNGVVAFGGGSSIDTAKGISVMAGNPGNILDYEGVGKLLKPGLPLVAIPTTAGTGSEVTASTIITNRVTSFKTAIISPYLFPTLAILDPSLTIKLPQGITAATGMDALTHAIESYTSKAASPVSQALAISAIKMIGGHIDKAYFAGSDLESREQMLLASMMAGMAFAQSRLGNVHAISHTLGGIFNIAHGIANATLLPYVMKFNLSACPERMRDISEALGCPTAGLGLMEAGQLAIDAVIGLNKRLQIPGTIRELGVDMNVLDKMVEDSMRSGNVLINPRLTTASDIRQIIENAFNGK